MTASKTCGNCLVEKLSESYLSLTVYSFVVCLLQGQAVDFHHPFQEKLFVEDISDGI